LRIRRRRRWPSFSNTVDARLMPAQTLAQKIIARAAGRDAVASGEIVDCEVDLAMFHDSSGPRRLAPMLAQLGVGIWNRERVVLVLDHYVGESDEASRRIVQIARDWATEQRLPHVHDSQGICHVLLPERGHLRPGLFGVGGDSHSPSAGAYGAFVFGIGSTEMLGVLVSGRIWLQVPQTIRYRFDGRLAPGVCAKDLMLMLVGRFGLNGAGYQVAEYAGEAVRALPMAERLTLCNMSAELGALTGLIAPDETTRAALAAAGVHVAEIEHWQGDADAPLQAEHAFDAAAIAPQVAAPHSPANAKPVAALAGERIDIAYIGACTGAKLHDLRAAAAVLRGQRIAAGMRLLLAPASRRELQQAETEGVLRSLADAGAELLPIGCGACAGYGNRFADGARVISSTARNFRGRMGGAGVEVFLASPATVAASALRGRITDPREVLA
jgi:3-isopropylmalate/(R)-2-methylmalate dehydratase large subunit